MRRILNIPVPNTDNPTIIARWQAAAVGLRRKSSWEMANISADMLKKVKEMLEKGHFWPSRTKVAIW